MKTTNQHENLNEMQVSEALQRMKMLKIHENAIADFLKDRTLNKSVGGFLYWLDDSEKKMVEEWQRKTGNLVYHVIKSGLECGVCYSLLYVSKDPGEWIFDCEDLEQNYAFAYVENTTDPSGSEYGGIGIHPQFGGVIRTS